MPPFDQSLALIAEMILSQVSADRITELYETPTAGGSSRFAPEGHDIVFEHVDFAYDEKEVLHDVSFTAKEGEVTALVGPSGSGKSTCARLAARLWDVTKGRILVGGVDISTVDPEVLLTDYSMVFQDVVLFDDTVMENIRLGKRGRHGCGSDRRSTGGQLRRICLKASAGGMTRPSVRTAQGSPEASASASPLPVRS